MTLKTLRYKGFRNLADADFSPNARINLLYGNNAQGKTNLLEAVWLLTGARSFRGAKDSELIRFGEQAAYISAVFNDALREQRIELAINGSRSAKLNGVGLDSPVGLAGVFCAVIFSPVHLGLVKESPGVRRRFIDAAICQLRPTHAKVLLEYKRLLEQRGALLKDIPYHAELLDTLEVWDERLCRIGAQLIFTRLRFLKRLSEKAVNIYEGIAKKREKLGLEYLSCEETPYPCTDIQSPEVQNEIYHTLKSLMKKTRVRDTACGYTHAGPHRDELLILIDGKSAKSYGSQGQQRSAALALKLAEAQVLCETIGEPPVLLLDDVMSELDPVRQSYLLNHIDGMQVFITCCEPSFKGALAGGAVFEVSGGSCAERS